MSLEKKSSKRELPGVREGKIAIVGAGRVGRAFAQALSQKGYRVAAVISRTLSSAQACAGLVDCFVASTALKDIPPTVSIILITAPDDAIKRIAKELVEVPVVTQGCFVAHTSGALSSEVLSPLRRKGAKAASIHPIQTFSGVKDEWKRMAGTYFGIEGEAEALKWARIIVRDLEGIPISIPKEAKGIYHLACSIASNYLVALMEAPFKMFEELGFSEQEAFQILKPLLSGTLENLETQGVHQALTGPISRGDRETVQGHLQILADRCPQFLPLYLVLGERAIEIGLAKGSIDKTKAQELLEMLQI